LRFPITTVELFFDTDNNNNNNNGDQGHGNNDGDASNGEEKYSKQYSPINLGNIHHKNLFNWNKTDDKVANGVDKLGAKGPTENMHVNGRQHVVIREQGYNQE
jgi:hypothetical protein